MSILWIIIILLVIFWALGFGLLPALGAFIHILLVLAVIVLLIRLIRGR